jgi:hypothetical protein
MHLKYCHTFYIVARGRILPFVRRQDGALEIEYSIKFAAGIPTEAKVICF